MPVALSEIWPTIRSALRDAAGEAAFELYLARLEPRALEGDVLVLEAPEPVLRWITGRFDRVVAAAAASALGARVQVRVEPAAGGRRPSGPWQRAGFAAGGALPPPPAAAEPPGEQDRGGVLNPDYTFDHFVIGDANRLAHAAALAVAEQPGEAYNPLFLCGPPGLGKTHLLHAIGHYVREHCDGLDVRYATVEGFTNHFVGALQQGAIDAFKARYRRCDVLLLDDIQFLESKARTGEELFHTVNALRDMGAQLVLTSDRLPHDLGALEARLRERFTAGLVCDVRPPDFGTRLAILRKRVAHGDVVLGDPGALEVIAERVEDSVRALEGALVRVVAFHSLTSRPIDAALAVEVLDRLYPHSRGRGRTVEDIQDAVARAFGIARDDLVSSSRAARVTWPRQVAMFLSRELTEQSLPAIGRRFGGRDHSTVLHAVRRTGERMATDPEAFAAVEALTRELHGRDDRGA